MEKGAEVLVEIEQSGAWMDKFQGKQHEGKMLSFVPHRNYIFFLE